MKKDFTKCPDKCNLRDYGVYCYYECEYNNKENTSNNKKCTGINEEEKLKGLEITMIKIRYTLVMLLMFLISIGFIGWAIVMLSGAK